MDWKLSEPDYPQITIRDEQVLGLTMWLEKILDMTASKHSNGPWDILIVDIWPNDMYSRVIGNVQMKDVAIGYDTGFRVCAYLSGTGIEGDRGNDKPRIKRLFDRAVAKDPLKSRLREMAKKNPFEIRISVMGDNNPRRFSRVKFDS